LLGVLAFIVNVDLLFALVVLVEASWDQAGIFLYDAFELYKYGLHFAIAVVVSGVVILATRHFFWQWNWPNRLTLWIIGVYLKWDACGSIYYHARRFLYTIRRREQISPRYEMVLHTLIQQKSSELEKQIDELEITVRNSPKEGQKTPPTDSMSQQLDTLASTLACNRQALADHYSPPYREPTERWTDAATLCDQSWLAGRRLVRLSTSSESAWQREAKNRALALYEAFGTEPELLSLESQFAHFRIAALEQPSDAGYEALTELVAKVEAFLFHDRHTLDKQTVLPEQKLLQFGLAAWLEMLASKSDHQAIIQTCARLAKSPDGSERRFGAEMYKYLGFAWWDYAHAIGNNDYGILAWQNALECFTMARFETALKKLGNPFIKR
jgi:hypothetical protein